MRTYNFHNLFFTAIFVLTHIHPTRIVWGKLLVFTVVKMLNYILITDLENFHWRCKVPELIWFPRFCSKSLQTWYSILDSDGVFCVSEGWSTSESLYTYSSADVYVQAWKFSISDILFTQTDTRGSGISVSSTITLPQPFNIDNHIFLVQVCSNKSASHDYSESTKEDVWLRFVNTYTRIKH